jgi:hypothetical protein
MQWIAGWFLTALLWAVPAQAQQALLGIYGAWVLDGESCSRIFANDNGRIVFGAEGRGPLPGFIIDPNSISNNEYLCAVREFTVRRADVTFVGQCEFGRRVRRQRFAMRELNGRFQMEINRIFVPVRRCEISSLKDLATIRAERERFERDNATALDKARGLWASSAALCDRAFLRNADGGYSIALGLPAGNLALMITPRRFVTGSAVCQSQQVVLNQRTGQDYEANYLCTAEGREFQTTERITIIDQDSIERLPASRNPVPQRFVRCTPPDWETVVRE